MYINRFFNNFFKEHGEIIWKEKLKYYHKNRYISKINRINYNDTSWKRLFKNSYNILFENNKILYKGGYYEECKLQYSSFNKTTIIFHGHGIIYHPDGNIHYNGEWEDG